MPFNKLYREESAYYLRVNDKCKGTGAFAIHLDQARTGMLVCLVSERHFRLQSATFNRNWSDVFSVPNINGSLL